MNLEALKKLCDDATIGPWEFRATEHSGGIKFVVAPNAPRNANGTEFIPADCSHSFNGRFIAASREMVPLLIAVAEAAQEVIRTCGGLPGTEVLHEMEKALEKLEAVK